MSETTNIEWCDSTFNPWIGCTKVSPACDHCYAERSTPARVHGVTWGAHAERRRTSPGNWALPRRWNAQAEAFQRQHGRRQRVFCASLADVFDNQVPEQWRADLFHLIQTTPNLDWLVLTKRIGNVERMLLDICHGADHDLPMLDMMPLPNLWLGATICNQEEAGRDIPKLLAAPARVRFLSIEPMLEPIDLVPYLHDIHLPVGQALHWVICGGESGPGARPMHPDWARSLRDQCEAAGVPFLFKQWGEWAPGSAFPYHIPGSTSCDFDGQLTTDDERVWKVGKKAAGRLLDGRTHDGFPS